MRHHFIVSLSYLAVYVQYFQTTVWRQQHSVWNIWTKHVPQKKLLFFYGMRNLHPLLIKCLLENGREAFKTKDYGRFHDFVFWRNYQTAVQSVMWTWIIETTAVKNWSLKLELKIYRFFAQLNLYLTKCSKKSLSKYYGFSNLTTMNTFGNKRDLLLFRIHILI